MIIEVMHFEEVNQYERGSIMLLYDDTDEARKDAFKEWLNSPQDTYKESWFVVNDFYFKCQKETESRVHLSQPIPSRDFNWGGNIEDIRTVKYQYEGPELRRWLHERNIAALIFKGLYPDSHVDIEPVGKLTKL